MDGEYRYKILPGISKNSEDIGLYNLLFDRWKELWVEVFSQVGRADEINVDDFYKQSLIATIIKDNSPIGLHLYSFYDLRLSAAREQAYFAGLPVEVLSFFESQGILRIMTMEYLTIFPEYRASLEGIRWAEVMISLGTRLLAYAPCDYAIGTARQDVKVNQMANNCQCQTSSIVISKYDYSCEVMYLKSGRGGRHVNADYQSLINKLWEEREDQSGISLVGDIDKIAA